MGTPAAYSIETPLGGSGRVFRARSASGTLVALTVVEVSPASLARFEQDAARARSVSHPNVARVLDAGHAGSTAWLAHELVQGSPLDELLALHVLGPHALAGIVAAVARALASAHEAGVAHGDVTARNILLDAALAPRLVGLAVPRRAPGTGPGDVASLGDVLARGLGADAPPLLARARAAAAEPDPARRPTAAGLAELLERASAAGARARPAPLGPGSRLGPYELLRPLGEGAMGDVFEARHEVSRAVHAIKVQKAAPLGRERFEREALALARIPAHRGVVAIHHSGWLEDGRGWFAMELVVGPSLRTVVAGGPLPVARAVSIAAAVAEALAHVHAHGIVHRDLKPENVLLRDGTEPVVADFGIVLVAADERLTESGLLVGTPQYMAPEQVVARRDAIGPPADVFALGVVLHELLAGEPPFARAANLHELLRAILVETPAPPGAARPEVPVELSALVLKATAKDPAARPTARDLGLALRAIARGDHVLPSRRPLLVPVLATCALCGLAALAYRGPEGAPRPVVILDDRARQSASAAVADALVSLEAGEPARAVTHLRAAQRVDTATAVSGVHAAFARAAVSSSSAVAVRALDALAAAFPSVAPPRAAAGPYLARAEERLAEPTPDPRAVVGLVDRALRLDGAARPSAPVAFALARWGLEAVRGGRLDDAAAILVVCARAGDPPVVAPEDLRELRRAGTFVRLARLDPSDWAVHFWLGAAADGGLDDADGDARRTLAGEGARSLRLVLAAAGVPEALRARASLLLLRAEGEVLEPGPFDERVAALAATAPEPWRVFAVAAAVDRARRRPERALASSRRALAALEARGAAEPRDRHDVLRLLVTALLDAGAHDEADERLGSAEARDAYGDHVHLVRASLEARRGRWAAALVHVEAFLALRPGDRVGLQRRATYRAALETGPR